jgi:hypothetical protein
MFGVEYVQEMVQRWIGLVYYSSATYCPSLTYYTRSSHVLVVESIDTSNVEIAWGGEGRVFLAEKLNTTRQCLLGDFNPWRQRIWEEVWEFCPSQGWWDTDGNALASSLETWRYRVRKQLRCSLPSISKHGALWDLIRIFAHGGHFDIIGRTIPYETATASSRWETGPAGKLKKSKRREVSSGWIWCSVAGKMVWVVSNLACPDLHDILKVLLEGWQLVLLVKAHERLLNMLHDKFSSLA